MRHPKQSPEAKTVTAERASLRASYTVYAQRPHRGETVAPKVYPPLPEAEAREQLADELRQAREMGWTIRCMRRGPWPLAHRIYYIESPHGHRIDRIEVIPEGMQIRKDRKYVEKERK